MLGPLGPLGPLLLLMVVVVVGAVVEVVVGMVALQHVFPPKSGVVRLVSVLQQGVGPGQGFPT